MSDLAKKLMVGEKIRHFANTEYGTIKKLAEALNMKHQGLDPYINNRSAPGMPLLYKLKQLGMNMDYLFTEGMPDTESFMYNQTRPNQMDLIMERLEEYNERLKKIEKQGE